VDGNNGANDSLTGAIVEMAETIELGLEIHASKRAARMRLEVATPQTSAGGDLKGEGREGCSDFRLDPVL